MPTDQEILDEQNRRIAAENAARQEAVGGQVNGIGSAAVGGITDPTTGLSKLWKSVKSSIGGQSTYQPGGYRLDQQQANTEMQLAGNARANQSLLGDQLQAQIQGRGPTVAAQQARFGIAEALRNAGTQAANARGVNRGMALRESMYAGQNAQEAANRDAAMLRASEQLGAMGQYGGLTSQQRGQDIQSRQVSLDAEKANQQAEMQRQGYQTQLADANATRAQKGTGAVLSSIGSVVKGLSDVRAKEDIEPMRNGSVAERLAAVRQSDEDELARRAEVESNARINAMLASSNTGYGAQQAALRNNETNGLQPTQGGGGLMDQVKSQGVTGAIGGGLESFGNGLMSDRRSKQNVAPIFRKERQIESRPSEFSEYEGERWSPYPSMDQVEYDEDGNVIGTKGMLSDQKSKERIRFLEGELYGRPRRELDQQNPYRTDYLSDTERRVENGFDSKAALKDVRPYSFRYRPQYAELMAEQSANMAPPAQKPLAALQAYDDARAPRPGVMAQDLEQTKQGSKVVEDTPVGKVLDMKRSVAFALANAADMNRRLAKLEGARK